ncbi:ecto-ADP-ribosyltransferase 5-like isoform X2 [Alligator sinensis]|nr:ecto-ADP-ribosyltransferase 5-like isoform X2 [Alligator sinensis]
MPWTQRILLLACLWSSSLAQNLAQNLAGVRGITRSMALNAVDDQYFGCTDDMEREAPALLQQELKGNFQFKGQWENALRKREEVNADLAMPQDFKDHGTAVIVYTDKGFHTDFMNAVKTNGKSSSYYKENFKFKAIHYYLTRALQLLGENAEWRYTGVVYRGSENWYQYNNSEIIRFGHFASTSLNKRIAKEFGNTTFFTIQTSFGVKIMNLSLQPSQEEVLIPVNEEFIVSPGGDGNNSYVLKSTGRACSYLNCAYLGTSSGGITFHGQMRPSLLGGAVLLLNAAALRLFAGA